VEVVDAILGQVDVLYWPVCRFVCKMWAALLPLRSQVKQARPRGLLSLDLSARLAREAPLAVLKWARSQGCPWDAGTCAAAARAGRPPVSPTS
jgi:hypothetical protein